MKIKKSELRKIIREVVKRPELKESLEIILNENPGMGMAIPTAVIKVGKAIGTAVNAVMMGAVLATDLTQAVVSSAPGGGTTNIE